MASKIIISNNHKNTSPSFSETMTILYNNKDIHGKHTPLLAKQYYESGQWERAIGEFDTLLKNDPGNQDALMAMKKSKVLNRHLFIKLMVLAMVLPSIKMK